MIEINEGVKDSIVDQIWYIEQTENILKGIDKRTEEAKESERAWKETKESYQKDIKIPYIESLKPFDIDAEEEESESEKVKGFAYSEINPYLSERIIKRIDKELRQKEINERIAKDNEKTKLFWLFSFLFGKNENKDIVKRYKKEEKERKERIRIFKEKDLKKIRDRTPIKSYDYTVSTQKLHEDRNFGANHNISKRKLKQIEVMKLQEKSLRKAHKILRQLKTMKAKDEVTDNYLKSLTIYISDIISDIEPYEVIEILNELQKDAFVNDQRQEIKENDTDKLIRYMDYSNQLEALRNYGISYKNLVNKDKKELKELQKERSIDI